MLIDEKIRIKFIIIYLIKEVSELQTYLLVENKLFILLFN
jgi:hypothetical protein